MYDPRLILLFANTCCLALPLPPIGRRTTVIDKPAVRPPFSETAQDKDLQKDLPPAPWTHETWDPGWLPRACVAEANYTGFKSTDFEAVEVWYADCAASWTVCRHRKADESWSYILDVSTHLGSYYRLSATPQLLTRCRH
jgi:hypothetical protein